MCRKKFNVFFTELPVFQFRAAGMKDRKADEGAIRRAFFNGNVMFGPIQWRDARVEGCTRTRERCWLVSREGTRGKFTFDRNSRGNDCIALLSERSHSVLRAA